MRHVGQGLLMFVLFTGMAWASPDAPLEGAGDRGASALEPTAPPIVTPSEGVAGGVSAEPRPEVRPLPQVTRGVLEGLSGAALGVGTSLALYALSSTPYVPGAAMLYGYPVGVTLGILGAGYLLDGDGSWWSTALGVGMGSAVGFVVMFVGAIASINGVETGRALPFVAVGAALPAIGGAVGFEISSTPSRTLTQSKRSGVRVAPLLAPTRDGAGLVFGLAGQM